ncbi:MAG: rod shape-determining protein MreC [Bryobacteraceae bacterium]
MESFVNRYRNLTILLLVIFAQFLLLAVQVKNDQDVRIIRVWTVTAVTPFARVVELLRGGSVGFIRNYILLHDEDAENRRLRDQVGRLKLDNIFLKNELNTAERAKALGVFQARIPSKTLAATVIGTGAGSNAKVVYVDAGSTRGVERGMAVVTPDGIVGKVLAAYPTASEILLATDADFAAGVVSQDGTVRGTLKGQGTPLVKIDYVPIQEKVQVGEWFYTSGDDRIFPRGFPVGVVRSVRDSQPFKEILLDVVGLEHVLEDVLIITQGEHQDIPPTPVADQPVYIAPPAPDEAKPVSPAAGGGPPPMTDADKLRQEYQAAGEAQGHKFGSLQSGPPDFTGIPTTLPRNPAPAAAPPAATPPAGAGPKPATGATTRTTESTRHSNQANGEPTGGKQK